MAPESNQASMTSGTRRYVPGSPSIVERDLVDEGTVRVELGQVATGSSESWARESTQTSFDGSSSLRQIGSGVPQYRLRDSAQSMLLFSQSP